MKSVVKTVSDSRQPHALAWLVIDPNGPVVRGESWVSHRSKSSGPRVTSFACPVMPRASFDVSLRLRHLLSPPDSRLRISSLELSFPSALAGHAALLESSTTQAVPLRRSDRPCGFSLCESRSQGLSNSRSLAARVRVTVARSTFTARCGSCIATSLAAMFRYPLVWAFVTWSHRTVKDAAGS